jgi:hypothetical protein
VNGAPARHRSFDPRRVGTLERDAWVAYYEHRWLRLSVVSVVLVRAGFRMGTVGTFRGAWHVLRANQLWAPFPDNDAEGARRQMERFYRLVSARGDDAIDPAVAARLEVEWWRTHRSLQHAARGDEDERGDRSGDRPVEGDLVAALADLYSYAYGVDRADVEPAARERAAAMAISDRWVEEGCPAGSPHLQAEGAALVRSYAALLAVVHR